MVLRLRINYRLEKIVINSKKYTYSEGTWSIAMTCSQDGSRDISWGVFCPEISGKENRVKQGFFIKYFHLIQEYLGRIRKLSIKSVQKIKVFNNSLFVGVVKGKGSKSS